MVVSSGTQRLFQKGVPFLKQPLSICRRNRLPGRCFLFYYSLRTIRQLINSCWQEPVLRPEWDSSIIRTAIIPKGTDDGKLDTCSTKDSYDSRHIGTFGR